jgi:hypothetical protein
VIRQVSTMAISRQKINGEGNGDGLAGRGRALAVVIRKGHPRVDLLTRWGPLTGRDVRQNDPFPCGRHFVTFTLQRRRRSVLLA